MADRDVLTDEMWARVEPLLPDRSPRRGRPWNDHRVMLEAMIWRFRTGSPWRDLPERFPPFQSVWARFNRWSADGTFDRILQVLQGHAQAAGQVDWTVSVDATIARAHQHAAGAPQTRKGGFIELQEFLARAG
jgi:transposase